MNWNTNLKISRLSQAKTRDGRAGGGVSDLIYPRVLAKREPLRSVIEKQGDKGTARITDQAIIRTTFTVKAYDLVEDLNTGDTFRVISILKYGTNHQVLQLEAQH